MPICDMVESVEYPKDNRLYHASCCGRRRRGKYVEVRHYYDQTLAFCKKGYGCEKDIPRKRVKAYTRRKPGSKYKTVKVKGHLRDRRRL